MAERHPMCTLSGHLIIKNGQRLPKPQSFEPSNVISYDSEIVSILGSTVKAKVLITGGNIQPNDTRVCVVANVGPMQPYGYLIKVLYTIPPGLTLYSVPWGQITVAGIVMTSPSLNDRNQMSFKIRTETNIGDNVWRWYMNCILPDGYTGQTVNVNTVVVLFGTVYSISVERNSNGGESQVLTVIVDKET